MWIYTITGLLFSGKTVDDLILNTSGKNRYMMRRFYVTMIVRFFIALVPDTDMGRFAAYLDAYLDNGKEWDAAEQYDPYLKDLIVGIGNRVGNLTNGTIRFVRDPQTIIPRLPSGKPLLPAYPATTI
jgi:hypothetical protein